MDTNQEVSGLPEPTALDPVANLDEETQSQATAAEGEADQQEEQAEQAKKSFSQEEVDTLIQKRLTKEARKEARKRERELAQKVSEFETRIAQLQQPAKQNTSEQPGTDQPQATEEQVIEAAKRLAPQFAQQAIEQQRQQQLLETFWTRADEVAERFPDFDQAVRDPSFVEMRGTIHEFVMDSDVGPELAYHLAKDRTKARAIARMSPVQAAKALVALEGELKAKPKATPSRAPDPINPVGNRGSASRSSMPSDDDDVDTWRQKELERMRKAGLIR